MPRKLNDTFDPVLSHVEKTFEEVGCSGVSVLVIHKDIIVSEAYWGRQSLAHHARTIQEDTQFHVASVRKSYIGFAVAYAVYHGFIQSIDDKVNLYLPEFSAEICGQTTIRHLLTHTHGLKKVDGCMIREFASGDNWAYRGINIDLLAEIIFHTTGKTIAQIVSEQVLEPLQLKETGWYGEINEKCVEVIRNPNDRNWHTSSNIAGAKMNMYVSTRDLAYWGYIHLMQGYLNGKQMIAKEIIKMATSLQSPELVDVDLPQNGFLWFVKDLPAMKTEIGDSVPKGSCQISGYTNVALLVIPQSNVVAVRMFNSFGSPPGFDYLANIRDFGDTVMECL